MIRNSFILLLSFVAFTICIHLRSVCFNNKYVFDIGSGTIKANGYNINRCTNKLERITPTHYNSEIKFQECLSKHSNDGKTIPEDCLLKGKRIIQDMKKKMGTDCSNHQCKAIATAWARTSNNAKEMIDIIEAEGIKISVLDQYQEGKLGFLSLPKSINEDSKHVIVFDLGGGSFQLATEDQSGQIHVHNGQYGMYNFRKLIAEKFAKNSSEILVRSQIPQIKQFAFKIIDEAIKHDSFLYGKNKLIGIGSFIHRGIGEQMEFGNKVSVLEVEKAINNFIGSTAAEIVEKYPKLPIEHAESSQYSLIIVHAVMKSLNIEQMTIVSNNLTNDYLATHDNI